MVCQRDGQRKRERAREQKTEKKARQLLVLLVYTRTQRKNKRDKEEQKWDVEGICRNHQDRLKVCRCPCADFKYRQNSRHLPQRVDTANACARSQDDDEISVQVGHGTRLPSGQKGATIRSGGWRFSLEQSRYASVYVSEGEAKEKENINEEVREGRAFVPEIPGMFKYYCGPCMIVKEGIQVGADALPPSKMRCATPPIMKSISHFSMIDIKLRTMIDNYRILRNQDT